jgi:WhiB family transcriptional regulator, redox-sensing transcriptional regulator
MSDHDPMPWAQHANCAGLDPSLMFPAPGDSTAPARAVCAACCVKNECLDYALAHNERYGIWGGLSTKERTAIRRAPKRLCDWCNGPLPDDERGRRYCGETCATEARRAVRREHMRRVRGAVA